MSRPASQPLSPMARPLASKNLIGSLAISNGLKSFAVSTDVPSNRQNSSPKANKERSGSKVRQWHSHSWLCVANRFLAFLRFSSKSRTRRVQFLPSRRKHCHLQNFNRGKTLFFQMITRHTADPQRPALRSLGVGGSAPRARTNIGGRAGIHPRRKTIADAATACACPPVSWRACSLACPEPTERAQVLCLTTRDLRAFQSSGHGFSHAEKGAQKTIPLRLFTRSLSCVPALATVIIPTLADREETKALTPVSSLSLFPGLSRLIWSDSSGWLPAAAGVLPFLGRSN
jgi:hypothetical protein